MSGLRHRREEYEDRERGRYRERRSSPPRERLSRYRSDSRSPTHYHSSSRHYQSTNRGSRNSRYNARRHSVSRSRSRSSSRSFSRSQRRSRTPSNSMNQGRRSRSTEVTADLHSRKHKDEGKQRKHETSTVQANEEQMTSNESSAIENLPLPPKKEPIGAYYNLDTDEPIDKEKIHREMEEKLRAALAKEGKVYPPPKPEASHPVFANDGSFIEIFKKMQHAQQQVSTSGGQTSTKTSAETASTSTAAAFVAATAVGKPAPPPLIVGRRRGGKILKTGLVAKPKAQGDDVGDPKDFWSIYLREVNKYKNNACESDGGTRPLVK